MNEQDRILRLLLVDDEEEFLTSTSRALSRRGFEVEVAPNGVTALELADSREFDAVVLDVKMPDIDGIDIFHQLRAKYPSLTILLLTGHGNIDDAFQTSKEGVADYLAKPIDMDELAVHVRRAVAHTEATLSLPDETLTAIGVPGEVSVMLVDDELDFLDTMHKVLSRRQLEVSTASSGQEALDLLQESLVDVVVLDIKMPGMDGLDVLKRIKENYPSVQVILLSGHPSVEDATHGIRLGANEYLRKPPKMDELAETIHRLYRERQEAILAQQQKLIDEIRRRYPD